MPIRRSLAAVLLACAPSAAAAQAAACPTAQQAAARPAAPPAAFAYVRAAPLDLRDEPDPRAPAGAPRRALDATIMRISYASPGGGRVTAMRLVPADSLRGADGRFAGVVLLHGAPGDAEGVVGLSAPIASRGAVVVAPDAPFARRDAQDPLAFGPRDSVEQVQLVQELQRAVDVLLARDDVDPRRLAFVGGSYGGAIGALLAGVERRLAAYALLLADGGIAAHFTQPDGTRQPPLPHRTAEQWCAWFAAMEPVAPLRFVGRATAPLHFAWGRQDPLVPPHLADALWAAAPEPKQRRWYDSGHQLPPEAWHDAIDFLAGHVGTRRAAR